MRRIMLIMLIIFYSVTIFATNQFGDNLIYNGKTMEIYTNPLESFFPPEKPRPNDLFKYKCTACWRGYVATWEIREDKLYLTKVVDGDCSVEARKDIDVSRLFKQKLPVFAQWYSGVLRIPQGKVLSNADMGYGTVFEKDLYLTIDKGALVKKEVVDNTKNKIPTEDESTVDEIKKLLEEATQAQKKNKYKNVGGMVFVYIPGGSFTIRGVGPPHKVTVSSFWIGKYEVTQKQYEAIMGRNPRKFKGDIKLVGPVSWIDAKNFCKQFSAKYGGTMRLPYEAEKIRKIV